jgi:glucokinase
MADARAVGVDIGGTFTKIAIVHATGTVEKQTRLPTGSHNEPEEFLARLKLDLQKYLDEEPDARGIGLALPGFLDERRRSITFNPNTPALVGYDFVDLLSPLGAVIHIETDLNVPAVAEYHLGAGKGSKRCMSATIGTGVGAAMVIDGQLLRITSDMIGDSGHVILDPEGPTCPVGCHGCTEALASTHAIERLARQVPTGWMRERREEDGTIPARAVIEACQAGDPLAVKILTEIGGWLGQWVASLAPIFLPDTFVLCGGVAEAGEPLRAACERRFYELAGPEYTRCTIKIGMFKGLAGVVGAAVPLLLE